MVLGLASADELVAAICAALGQHISDEEGTELVACQVAQAIARSYSTIRILSVRTGTGIRRMVAKTTRHHPDNRMVNDRENQAVVEFQILSQLHECFEGIARCSVPRPLLLLADLDTYLMEYVNGDMLANELRCARYLYPQESFGRLVQHIRDCGRWLKYFQECTRIAPGGMDALDEILDRCDSRLQFIDEARDPRCPHNLRKQVTTFLQEQEAKLAGARIELAGRHGDFGTWNILANDDGITVLDFFGYGYGPVCWDSLSILLELECLRRCLPASPRRISALQTTFIDGLGRLPLVPKPLLYICETLLRLISLYGSLCTEGEGLSRRWQKRLTLKDNIKWLQSGERAELLWPAEAIAA